MLARHDFETDTVFTLLKPIVHEACFLHCMINVNMFCSPFDSRQTYNTVSFASSAMLSQSTF